MTMSKVFKFDQDIVISVRIRFARNLKAFPFPERLSQNDRIKVNELVKNAIIGGNSVIAKDFTYYDMNALSQIEKTALVEKHLISPAFASNKKPSGLLLMNDDINSVDPIVSIMIGEEDHIRLQVMQYGLKFSEVYDVARKIDALLDEQLEFAFNDRLGYLTQCPTNLGTGMRASVMLHLPALQENGVMDRMQMDLSKLGLTLRGTYGEGTKAKSAMYQLSNQVTLGLSEDDAIKNLQDVAKQMIAQERVARETLLKNIKTKDVIARSLGILKSAKLLSADECTALLLNVRLGVSVGEIDNLSIEFINKLLYMIPPATLMGIVGEKMTPLDRDERRASIMKKNLCDL